MICPLGSNDAPQGAQRGHLNTLICSACARMSQTTFLRLVWVWGFFDMTFLSKLKLIHSVRGVKVASGRTGMVSGMVSGMISGMVSGKVSGMVSEMVSGMVSGMDSPRNSWTTHPGLVERLHLSLALLGDLLVAALHAFDDALHVQVPAVVHLYDDRGVTQLTVQLSPLLQDQSISSVPSTSPSQQPQQGGSGGRRFCPELPAGVLRLCPARPGSWDLFWWHSVGWLHALP